MPDISEFGTSKYLKKEELGNGKLLTIKTCERENVAKQGEKPEWKFVLYWNEDDVKPMICNTTNAQLIAGFSGIRNSDDWAGIKLVAYNDQSVFYAGKQGGIRVRAPKGKAVMTPKPPEPPSDDPEEDDIPF